MLVSRVIARERDIHPLITLIALNQPRYRYPLITLITLVNTREIEFLQRQASKPLQDSHASEVVVAQRQMS